MNTKSYPCCPNCNLFNVIVDRAVVWDMVIQRWISAHGDYYSKSGYCQVCNEEIRYLDWIDSDASIEASNWVSYA